MTHNPETVGPDLSLDRLVTPMVDTFIVSPKSLMTDVLERMSENETRRVT